MRRHTAPEGLPSTRTLVTLTVTYIVAAGCHAVLAVVFEVRWHGVLAVLLTTAASGFLAYAARSARTPRPPVVPPPRQGAPARDWDAALEELVRTSRGTCDDAVL